MLAEVSVTLQLLTCFNLLTFVCCLEFDFYRRYRKKIVFVAQQAQKQLFHPRWRSCNKTFEMGSF